MLEVLDNTANGYQALFSNIEGFHVAAVAAGLSQPSSIP
jgi:hypothetical protein